MKKSCLVGYTGFVGSNLELQYHFTHKYNSKNIELAFGTKPDVCVYAGVPAEMFLANNDPDADLDVIKNAIKNIKSIGADKVILLSTITVYDDCLDVNEDDYIDESKLTAYGKNRRYLEKWILDNIKQPTVIRLPAIYGKNLKKNFLYDIINISPSLLKKDKFWELCAQDNFIEKYYSKQKNGFYKCIDSKAVKSYFENIGFSALSFTDSRSIYQFYNLQYLWKQIEDILDSKINIFNIATEPVSAGEVYYYLKNKIFTNILDKPPFKYDMRTKYASTGYLFNKNEVLEDIRRYVEVYT